MLWQSIKNFKAEGVIKQRGFSMYETQKSILKVIMAMNYSQQKFEKKNHFKNIKIFWRAVGINLGLFIYNVTYPG